MVLATILLAACGGGDDFEEAPAAERSARAAPAGAAMADPEATAAPAFQAMAEPASEAASDPEPTPAPSQESTSFATVDVSTGANGSSANGEVATLVRQQRIVVRTVDMSLVVAGGIQASMDRVASVADSMGGWTVSSER